MSRRFGPTENFSKGFTLLEVLVAIVILSVGLLGMASLTGSIIGYNQFADNVTTATTLAQDKIEELKNTSYDDISVDPDTVTENDIDADGNPGGIYDRETKVDNNSPATNTKTITVTVTWNWKGTAKEVVLKTIIAK